MINKILLIAFLISFFGTIYFSFLATPSKEIIEKIMNKNDSSEQIYHNKEWGFRFKYPENWKVSEEIIRSESIIFSLALETNEATIPTKPIVINITDQNSVESTFKKLRENRISRILTEIDHRPGSYSELQNAGISTHNYYVPVKDNYWIHIKSDNKYKNTLNKIIDSFEFSDSPESKVYKNEEWGFQFEYPGNWEVKENTFRSGASLFNVSVEPKGNNHLPDPVLVNIAPTAWGNRLLDKMGLTDEDIRYVKEKKSYYATTTDMSIPAQSYLIPINETFWINIIGKDSYQKTLNQILNSFEIIE